jgi:hypothetical protein
MCEPLTLYVGIDGADDVPVAQVPAAVSLLSVTD